MIGSLEHEDIFQASTADGGTSLTVPNLRDDVAGLHDPIDGSRFPCSAPACTGTSFKHKKDLKRHEQKHDPNATLWKCGCCQNLGHTFGGSTRKDKVRDHLRGQHQHEKNKSKRIGEMCPEEDCYTLFTAASCLREHLRQEHRRCTREMQSQTIDGK